MQIVKCCFCVLYAGFMIFASAMEYKRVKHLNLLLLQGSLLLLIAGVLAFVNSLASFVVLLVGLLLIHVGALVNGKQNGKIHLSHHLARLAVSAVIALLCWFG